MANKIQMATDYIAKLKPGETVSVRSLSRSLGISEGTAYRSIKTAEAQGLVLTRPKVGTVRVNLRGTNYNSVMSLSEAARSVGAVCLCGADRAMSRSLPSLIIADGSEEQFSSQLERTGRVSLCLIGDRPEIQRLAVSGRADILLTGGASADAALLEEADGNGCCVFSSEQDSYTLLGMLRRRSPSELPHQQMSRVSDWMQLPKYLYNDDIIAAVYRQYGDFFIRTSRCAVVDDSLKICGTLGFSDILNAPPSSQISDLMSTALDNCIIDENVGMDELAEKFLKQQQLYASVTGDEGVSGFISIFDILRYLQYSKDSVRPSYSAGKLELSSDDEDSIRQVYTLYLGNQSRLADRSRYIGYITSAAARHAFELFGNAASFENGTFYSPSPLVEEGEYMISSEVMKRNGESAVLELEMFDDKATYFKATITLSAEHS